LQQIAKLWATLEPRRRIVVALATVAMFAAVFALARTAATPGLSLLYGGLESGAAGEVIAALEQKGVVHEVRGGAIFVDSARRDELRMTLASEGLPRNSTRGYELLDGLSGFGTTSQMFDAAYWRAKEGELARTIVAHPAISSARVHIANAVGSPFQRDLRPKASVSVVGGAGEISATQARALRYLVASAVAGLSAENVSVIDGNGELVGATEDSHASATDTRAESLRRRVERLLAARVGPGNAVVEVSVEAVTRSESLRERVIDPQSRVAISIDTEEREKADTDEGGGVTVASNLPDGDAAGPESSSSQTTETRERINYEVSETERQVTLAPGAIKRLTVAALINGTFAPDASGTPVFQPRPEEELAALRELVASAVGLDEARGDAITLKSMRFEPVGPAGTEAVDPPFPGLGADPMSLVRIAALAVVALVLGLFVVRPVLTRPAAGPMARLAAPEAPPPVPDGLDRAGPLRSLTGEIEAAPDAPSRMTLIPAPDGHDGVGTMRVAAAGDDLSGPEDGGNDPVLRLRSLIGERRDEAVEILRTWLEGEEEKAG